MMDSDVWELWNHKELSLAKQEHNCWDLYWGCYQVFIQDLDTPVFLSQAGEEAFFTALPATPLYSSLFACVCVAAHHWYTNFSTVKH